MNTLAPAIHFPDHWKVFPKSDAEPTALGAATAPGERTRILIADDDRICRELLASRLNRAGYEVIVTHDGQGAIEELRKPNAPAVAILDWLMPGLDGPAICQRMREADKAVYLILLTSRTRKEDVVEGLDSGADDYLVKPFETQELLARVKVGLRIIGLQRVLSDEVAQLKAPLPDPANKLNISIL